MKFVGTGAWIPTAYVDGTRQTFKANPDYYRTWDEWADEILDKLVAATTLDERRSLIQAFEKRYIAEGPPLLQTRHPADNLAIHSHVAGNDLAAGPWAYNVYGVSPPWVWFTEKYRPSDFRPASVRVVAGKRGRIPATPSIFADRRALRHLSNAALPAPSTVVI